MLRHRLNPVHYFLRNLGLWRKVDLFTMLSFLVAGALADTLVRSARDQLTWGTTYDPAYTRLKYPGGDVARSKGVCTDIVIRAYRAAGIDLQKLVYVDKKAARSAYPKDPLDPNIDHRRVKNLAVFFRRKGRTLPLAKDWKAGDIVCWKLPNGRDHIGLVTVPSLGRVVHNISTPAEDACLTTWKVVGHYRYP